MLYDPYNNKKRIIQRIANIHPTNKIRLDTWMDVGGDNIKISHFGDIQSSNKIKVRDFIYTLSDRNGNIKDFTSSIMSNGYINGGNPSMYPWNFIDPNGINIISPNKEEMSPEIDMADIYTKAVKSVNIVDNMAYTFDTEIFEDETNLPFQIYAYVLAALSAAAMNSTYEAYIIMDSVNGFNINDIKRSKVDLDNDNSFKIKIKNLISFMSKVNKGFKISSAKEFANLRIYGYIYPFGAVVEILHRNLGNISFRNHINISDHCRVLRTIESRGSKDYFNSELFEAMNTEGYPSAISSLFDSSEERDGFYKGYITENFISDWKGGQRWL